MIKRSLTCLILASIATGNPVYAQRVSTARLERLVEETHARSLALREKTLDQIVASGSCWPGGVWGDTMWALAALYRNDRVAEANARLLEHAQAYLESVEKTGETSSSPEDTANTPWAYFALGDYVRILSLFHANSPHFPGRLTPETERAMKESVWNLVQRQSRIANACQNSLLVLLGTENHDLTRRPNEYLIAALLKDDPHFRDRKYDDGHTAEEHFQAYNAFFNAWPGERVANGLWIEVGSDRYQKYSWPALFNLHELSPDPVVRKRFGMLLDLALIEEEQLSVRGRRGGGRSRASYGENSFEQYKNLLFADEAIASGGSHSKILETSRYQLPAAAIYLRYVELPAQQPFAINNRVLGELHSEPPPGSQGTRFAADSALVNTVWRTPAYLMGSALQDPSLAMTNAEGQLVLKYGGISRQQRWCGILFDDPTARAPQMRPLDNRSDDELCAIYPVVEQTRGGRPQHSFWSAQERNVLLIERIPPQVPEHPMRMGSYSTGRVGIRFHGRRLSRVEQDGWIFASNDQAYAAVRFLDHDYEWDATGEVAWPVDCDPKRCTTRILIHAGDRQAHGSFFRFRSMILANPLEIEEDSVTYSFGPEPTRMTAYPYDPDHPEKYRLPQINGNAIELRPARTFSSPYLNSRWGDPRIQVTVGPMILLYDFLVPDIIPLTVK